MRRRRVRTPIAQGGRIAERGAHDELLARGGLYADLYRRQFRDPAPGPAPSAATVA